MIDLQLPSPLNVPSLWLSTKGPRLFALSTLALGGPFATARAQLPPPAFVVPEHFWLDHAPSFFLVMEAEFASRYRGQRLQLFTRAPLVDVERTSWMGFGSRIGVTFDFVTDRTLKVPTLFDWSREVFAAAFREAGELAWTSALRDYEKQLGGVPSFDELRFLPGFLRSRKAHFATTAAVEWATAQALFSPQDDHRGKGSSVILNPTLQTVADDREGRTQLLTIWRVDGVLQQDAHDWQIAAVVDELRENPRVVLSMLRMILAQKSFPFKSTRSFDSVIDALLASGVLLLR